MASLWSNNSTSTPSPFSSYNSLEQARMNSFLNDMLQFDGNVTDVDDEMASTEKRFETFKRWPDSSPLKPVDLVNAGFYYTGVRDEVRCFACDLQLKEWKIGDDPFDEHRKRNSNCNFVIEYEREKFGITCNPVAASVLETGSQSNNPGEISHPRYPYFSQQSIFRDPPQTAFMQHYPSNNQPPHQGLSHVSSPSRVFVTSQYPRTNRPTLQTPDQFTVRPNYPSSFGMQQVPTAITQPSSNTYAGMSMANSQPIHDQFIIRPNYPSSPGIQQVSTAITQPSSNTYAGMSTGFHGSTRQPSNHGSMRNIDIPVLSPVRQHVPNVHIRTEDTHHTASQNDLQSIHHRLATFIDWPEDCPVHPWELAAAGFFYMGNGDNVKCYRCKVALRNWEPDDTPWSEHKRWSPDCPLVKEYVENPRVPVEDQEQTTAETPSQRFHTMASMSGTPGFENPNILSSQPETNQQHSLRTYTEVQNENLPQHGVWGKASSQGEQHKYTSNLVRPSSSSCAVSAAATKYDPSFNSTSLDDTDFVRVMEMGFTSEDINNAVAKQTARTGTGFAKLNDLMQALLDDSQASLTRPEQIVNPTESYPEIAAGHSSPASPPQNPLVHSHSFSFDKINLGPKRGLKRSNSAPPVGLASNPSTQAGRDLDSMQEERLICKICMDAEVGVVFIPCGHISCCPDCATGLDLCPMCRKPIQQVIRTFLS